MKHDIKYSIGIIGCGNISQIYLRAAQYFPMLEIIGIADINHQAAVNRANEFNLAVFTVDELLANPEIQLIINLTTPQNHVAVGKSILNSGKHVYGEKPLGLNTHEAKELLALAASKQLRVGSAPDTFLGGAHQLCKQLIESNSIGQVIAGTAFFMCGGHEGWHPNPDFYYQKGAGPLFDMGPYYLTALVNMLGPIKKVCAMTSAIRKVRTIDSDHRRGEKINVEVPTHYAGILQFSSGALITLIMSFDVLTHKHNPIEIYGTKGTLLIPDPNFFGGEVFLAKSYDAFEQVENAYPYTEDNYRMLGVAEMLCALNEKRPHLAHSDLAYHVLEVMEAFEIANQSGTDVTISSQPQKTAFLNIKMQGVDYA